MTFLASFNAQSDWTHYSPTYSAEDGATPSLGNGILDGYWARLHDSAIISIYWKPGSTTTFTSLPGEVFNFSMPSGLDIEETLLAGSFLSGTGFCLDSSTPANSVGCIPVKREIDQIGFIPDGNSTGYGDAPFTWAEDDELFLEFIVPIVGW